SDFIAEPRPGDQQLSFLPLSHIAERTFTVFYPLRSGATVNFAESIDTVPENIREVAPAVFFAVPRIWEKFYSAVALRMREATLPGKLAYAWAIGVGARMAERRIEGRRPPAWLRLLYRVADFLVLDNLKRSMGLHRARGAATGAAPIAPELIKWYMALGIDMREVYGQTENCGLATAMPADRIKLGTVGVARPDTEVRVSAQGEILLRGPHVFLGYYKNPQKTAETVVDGWLHTGDVGLVDAQGFVTITDRMKDIIITAGGKNITPAATANQLKFSPYISDAVLVGAVALAPAALAQRMEARGVSKTEIVLGMHTDLSGPAATYGVSSSNAVKMRFDEVNAAGGVHGRKIRLVVEDTQYQVPRAVQ